MANLELPVTSDVPSYQFSVDLDGRNYKMKFRYNLRQLRWIWDILDTDENDILVGIPLLTNIGLNMRFNKESMPPGRFILIDEGGEDKDAERDDLGSRVKMLYIEAE